MFLQLQTHCYTISHVVEFKAGIKVKVDYDSSPDNAVFGRIGETELVLESCSVCISEYIDGERIRVLPCLHHYHAPCIDQWLGKKKNCPLYEQLQRCYMSFLDV